MAPTNILVEKGNTILAFSLSILLALSNCQSASSLSMDENLSPKTSENSAAENVDNAMSSDDKQEAQDEFDIFDRPVTQLDVSKKSFSSLSPQAKELIDDLGIQHEIDLSKKAHSAYLSHKSPDSKLNFIFLHVYSGAKWPLVPSENGQPFRSKMANDSG